MPLAVLEETTSMKKTYVMALVAIASACASPMPTNYGVDDRSGGKGDGWDEGPGECGVCLRATLDPSSSLPNVWSACATSDACVSDDIYAGTSDQDVIEAAPLTIVSDSCSCETAWLDVTSATSDVTSEWIEDVYDVDEDDDYIALSDEDLYAFGQAIGAL